MRFPSFVFAAAAALVSVTACEGLKQAMTAHVDTAAKAGSQELSVDRLAKLLGEATVQPTRPVASAIANAWIDYDLLAQAAASGDTTLTPKEMDAALWAPIAATRAKKYYDIVSKSWSTGNDSSSARQMYENGDILAASHILLLTRGMTPDQKASAKQKIDALRAKATSANFAQLAAGNSQDPQSAQRGGSLGLFRPGSMVKPFEDALKATKPGDISPVIETEYGYHIIRRPTYAEVAPMVAQAAQGRSVQKAESTFVVKLQNDAKIQFKGDAAKTARMVIADPAGHADDDATIATYNGGTFTAATFAKWLNTFPAAVRDRQADQLATAPDTVVTGTVKNFIVNELVLRNADSLHIALTPQEQSQMRSALVQARSAIWGQLGIDPKSLGDSAKTPDARLKLAQSRIDKYMDALVAGRAQFVQIPEPLSSLLRDKMKSSVNGAGLDRAVERAVRDRQFADSTHRAASGQPSSAVPMPAGAVGGAPGAAPSGAPAGAPPAGQGGTGAPPTP